MQLQLPFLRTPPPDPAIDFVRTRRAKRYILRVRPDGSLRVTIPRGGSRAEALRFVEGQVHWILQQRTRLAERPPAAVWRHGTEILLAGAPVPILVAPHPAGAMRTVSYGPRQLSVPADTADLRSAIEADLRALARETLPPRLHEIAAGHGLSVTRVTIRNQRSRWGSCSRSGAIALNYRLVQMPPDVSDYILVHELMHLRQQNHGPRFWRLVQAACPRFRDAERWLKTEGRRLFDRSI